MTPGDGQFTTNIFNLYGKWAKLDDDDHDAQAAARLSIARGEKIFNTLQIPINGVAGINDDVAAGAWSLAEFPPSRETAPLAMIRRTSVTILFPHP